MHRYFPGSIGPAPFLILAPGQRNRRKSKRHYDAHNSFHFHVNSFLYIREWGMGSGEWSCCSQSNRENNTQRFRTKTLLPLHYSLFPIPYSLLPLHYSLFPIPYSLLPTPYSPTPLFSSLHPANRDPLHIVFLHKRIEQDNRPCHHYRQGHLESLRRHVDRRGSPGTGGAGFQ